jgi:hypothetical protein
MPFSWHTYFAVSLPSMVRSRVSWKEDGGQHLGGVEAGAADDPLSHTVHQLEHLGIVGVGAGLDAIGRQHPRRAAPALIDGGYEPAALPPPIEPLA